MLLFISCSVPSAICFHLVNNANFHSTCLQFSNKCLHALSGSPLMCLDSVSCGHPQSHRAGLLPVPPSCSLCCIAYSEHAPGPRISFSLLWVVFSFLFVPLSSCSSPIVFCVFCSPCKLVKRLCSWVFIQHTQINEAFEHAKGVWELH